MFSALSVLAVASVATAQSVSYDYVIVGGGTSGLVVANRLSELKDVTVAVIEAGDSQYDNPNVTSATGYGLAFGTEIDWAYETTNQTYGGGLQQTVRAGKAIGGTSTINGMAYTRAENVQIDVWEKMGNKGWNWDALLPYYEKSQMLQYPTEEQAETGVTYNASVYGSSGPLKVGWNYDLATDDLHTIFNDTFAAVGVEWIEDVNDGTMVGYNRYPATLDVDLNVRHDAGRAYYFPIANRTNLHLYPNTFAQRITWDSDCQTPTANGVEVLEANSSTPYTISAKEEVILSAGSLASPLILELSGVGNPEILSKYNIDVVVDLPTVGENLQDQTNTGLTSDAPGQNYSGPGHYVAYPSAAQIFGSSVTNISASIWAALPSYADQVAIASGNVTKASDLLEAFKLQHDLLFSTEHPVPMAEVLMEPSGAAVDVEYWTLLPFSRGNVHINSSVPGARAAINPNYFMLDWDVLSQVDTAKWIRGLFSVAPFGDLLGEETKPGLDVVAENATQEEWFDWVTGVYRSNFHPVATTAMMPQENGGVVDETLKVYGTANVRVVDAGVLPVQVCGHLVSTLYAVAEKASDLIKAAKTN